MDVDIPALNDNEVLYNDEPVVVAEYDLANTKCVQSNVGMYKLRDAYLVNYYDYSIEHA